MMVPVHFQDHLLLSMLWEGSLYIDSSLPFGLRSAPQIFTAIADALKWMIRHVGVKSIFYYLNDFLIIAPADSDQFKVDLGKLMTTFDRLNVPVAEEKTKGPATYLCFLGIEIDTQEMILRLPD